MRLLFLLRFWMGLIFEGKLYYLGGIGACFSMIFSFFFFFFLLPLKFQLL